MAEILVTSSKLSKSSEVIAGEREAHAGCSEIAHFRQLAFGTERLGVATILRCGQLDFGKTPTAHGRKREHPSTAAITDPTSKKRILPIYRVQASDENRLKEIGASDCSGVHLEELDL